MRFACSFVAAGLAALSIAAAAHAQSGNPSAGRYVTYPNLPPAVVQAAKQQWFDASGGKSGAQSKLTFNLVLLNQEYLNFKRTGAGGPLFVPKTDSVSVVQDPGSGNYYVSIDALAASSGTQLRADLEALGLKDIYNTPLPAPFDQAQQQAEQILANSLVVGGLLPIDSLPQAAQLASLRAARASFAQANAGAVTSQGDHAQNSDAARSQFGIDGSHVPAFLGNYLGLDIRGVSVFSDSFNCLGGAATDIANGDLPPASETFDIVDYCPGGEDEGRAMAQIVHDVAPGAPISFFTAFQSEFNFANYILISGIVGIPVQVDDVQYFDEPMYQDGWLAQIIEYNQTHFHTTHFSSAGNEARQSYEAPFTPAVLKPNQIPAINNVFGGSVMQGFTNKSNGSQTPLLPVEIPAGDLVILSFQWDDADFAQSTCTLFGGGGCSGPQTDMDIYLLDENYCLVGGSFDDNFATGQPVEIFGFFNNLTLIGLDPCGQAVKTTNFYIAMVNFLGPNPGRVKFVEFTGSMYIPPQYDTLSSTVFGHANAEHALAVGAAKYDRTPNFGIDPARLEFFSSAGATPILFDTQGNRLSQPILRTKPDITAPDGGDIANTFQGQFGADTDGDGFPNFFGTSAAAPHAAGVGLLMQDYAVSVFPPSLRPFSAIRQALMGTAHDMVSRALNTNTFFNSPQQVNDVLGPIGSGFDCDSGAGLIDAVLAIQTTGPTATFPPIPGPPPCSGPAPTKPPLPQFILRNGQIIPVDFTVNQGGSSSGGSGGTTTTTTSSSSGGAFDPALLIGLPALLAWRRRKARLLP
jgi:hypothetical protein